FPLSGVAFLLITPEEFPEKAECEEFFKRIEKFIQVHRNSFLLLQAPAYGARELEIVSAVQNRFFGSNLKVLPVHSNGDAVKGMLTIAKAMIYVLWKNHVSDASTQEKSGKLRGMNYTQHGVMVSHLFSTEHLLCLN
ncbi:hypothetical protein PGIGA_G00110710, partial [Pangasianodon gigas]|nr:hypothetical protein [Pangasianodon gigas]